MKRQLSILLNLFLLLALSACGLTQTSPSPTPSPTATTQPSRLPEPDEVKALLVQLVDEEKVAPGIVVGMIAADPQERRVVGYGRLNATDERVPVDGGFEGALQFKPAFFQRESEETAYAVSSDCRERRVWP